MSSKRAKKRTAGARPGTTKLSTGWSTKTAGWSAAVVFLLALLLWGIYGRTMSSPLVFDDRTSVIENSSIMKLWPLVGDRMPGPLNPPAGIPTSGRPLVNLTLALNYHYGALSPWGYRCFNLVVHLLAALLVGLIVKRILELDFFAARFSGSSDALAMLTAVLWAVHPLQTESVIYVTQRTELMVGLFYLATVYGSLRYWSAPLGRWRQLWIGVSTLACLAGMSCKEVMVTVPIVVLLLERTLITGTFRAALRQSWPLYAGLAMGWVLLAALNYDAPRSASAGFHLSVPAYVWWFTQSKVLWMYFKLAVWPWPLLIHYYVPYVETFGEAWPWLLATTVLVGITTVFVWRRQATGLVGAWVLLILSPTFVVPIITEVAAERRMYLPLAGIVLLGTASGFLLVRRAIFWIGGTDRAVGTTKPGRATAMVAAMGTMLAIVWSVVDVHRLAAFQDPITLWQDTIREGAADSFAYNNLGYELVNAQRLQEAMQPLQQALTLDSSEPKIYTNLGMALDGLGRSEEAIEEFQKALKIDPSYAVAKRNLALSLAKAGRAKDGIAELEAVVGAHPNDATAHYDLGIALGQAGRFPEAIEQFQLAVAIRPEYPAAYNNLGVALLKLQQMEAAIRAFETAIAFDPKSGEAHKNLGVVLMSAGRPQEAISHFEELLRLDPEHATAIQMAIGDAYLSLKKPTEAIEHFRKAVESNSAPAVAHEKLGDVLADQGRSAEAIAEFEKALSAAQSQGNAALAQEMESRLKSYRAGPTGGK